MKRWDFGITILQVLAVFGGCAKRQAIKDAIHKMYPTATEHTIKYEVGWALSALKLRGEHVGNNGAKDAVWWITPKGEKTLAEYAERPEEFAKVFKHARAS
jgi:hypothetical protein